jgi:GDSL-like Lipase/Acylhydrolase family
MANAPTAEPAKRGRTWATLAGNVALALVAVLVALLLGELVARLSGVAYTVYVWTDPIRGMAHIPGARSVRQSNGRPWIEINSDGWRGPDVPLAAAPGTFRIALLGDSYIEGFEVPFEKTVGEVLEGHLSALRGGRVEVLNFGHGGYGTTQELLTLQHEVWKYSPDLVLLAVTTGNDISDNSRRLKRIDYVPYHVFQGDRLVLDTSFRQSDDYRSRALWTQRLLVLMQHSRLAQLVNRVRRSSRQTEQQQANRTPGEEVGMRDEVHLPPATPDWEEAWHVTEALIRQMRDECRAHGIPFAMVTLTRGIQVTPVPEDKVHFLRALGAPDLYYAERRLAALGRQESIPVLNLAPAMAEQAIRDRVYYHAHRDSLGVGHWSEAGHRAAADLIAAWFPTAFPRMVVGQGRAGDGSP